MDLYYMEESDASHHHQLMLEKSNQFLFDSLMAVKKGAIDTIAAKQE